MRRDRTPDVDVQINEAGRQAGIEAVLLATFATLLALGLASILDDSVRPVPAVPRIA